MKYRMGALAILFLISLGCTDSGTSSSEKGLIGITVMSSENPFFNVLANAAAAEAELNGYDSEILSGDNDPDKQDRQIKDFIAKKVAAIIIRVNQFDALKIISTASNREYAISYVIF